MRREGRDRRSPTHDVERERDARPIFDGLYDQKRDERRASEILERLVGAELVWPQPQLARPHLMDEPFGLVSWCHARLRAGVLERACQTAGRFVELAAIESLTEPMPLQLAARRPGKTR